MLVRLLTLEDLVARKAKAVVDRKLELSMVKAVAMLEWTLGRGE